MDRIKLTDVKKTYPTPDYITIRRELEEQLQNSNSVIAVLDDDPTGIQTVYDVPVYTDWRSETIQTAIAKDKMFFILTNTRAFSADEASLINHTIGELLAKEFSKQGKNILVISRGDSTLRGYYPLEVDMLRKAIEQNSSIRFDGEIICPYFEEGGRYTVNDIHYVANQDDELIPVAETDYAKDPTFGFLHSNLAEWVLEKAGSGRSREDIFSISIDTLRKENGAELVQNILEKNKCYHTILVNAVERADIQVFCTGLLRALKNGKHYLIRSSSSIPKELLCKPQRKLLTGEEVRIQDSNKGGLIIVGSHVKKTTEQLRKVKERVPGVEMIEFNQHLALDPGLLSEEVTRVLEEAEKSIENGNDAVIYTRRERLDIGTQDKEKELQLACRISEALTDVVKKLKVQPAYLIAKGGITSSDIGTKGLGVHKAIVLGQIEPGIPVWKTDATSKFPGMSYVIFPGNVGKAGTLAKIMMLLKM